MKPEFREAASQKELHALFNLRRDVYSKAESLKTMVHGIDITGFDLNALHFGAFDGLVPIGYMRMVGQKETRFAPWIKNIAADEIIDIPNKISFPFELYCPHKNWNLDFLNDLQGKKIGEAGKLAIHKDYRNGSMLEDFIKAFVTYCKEGQKFDSGFGICTFALERYYKKLGFYRAPGALPFIHKDLPEAVMLRFDRE